MLGVFSLSDLERLQAAMGAHGVRRDRVHPSAVQQDLEAGHRALQQVRLPALLPCPHYVAPVIPRYRNLKIKGQQVSSSGQQAEKSTKQRPVTGQTW